MKSVGRDYEDLMDCERRFEKYSQFIVGKNICDFGCGAGSFLRKSSSSAKYVSGIELQIDFSEALNRDGIDCFNDLQESKVTYDSIFLFHCLEHLQDPISILKGIYSKLKPCGEGRIVIEVPHARDFLMDKLCNKSFLDFTLWSQHLILHTRHSLGAMLNDAGYKNITIEGIQRYSIANHINWLKDSRPGGHKEPLSIFETQDLREAYALALSKIDANDTLVAIATT